MSVLEKLKEKISIAEGSIIGCLYKEPDLFSEYTLNKAELSEDALFYYTLGENLYKLNHSIFDEVTIFAYLKGNDALTSYWEEKGGYSTVKSLTSIVSPSNMDGYYDTLNKYHLLRNLHQKGFNIEIDWDKFERMTTTQVFDYFEYQLNSITIDTAGDLNFETLDLTDAELDEIEQGLNVGLSYAKHSPQANYMTMGLPKADLTMIASFVNGGKSSFITNNIIIPVAEQKNKVAIISNEQRSIVYKLLLLVYVLTEDLGYWKLTRKKIKAGKYTSEDKEMIYKAREIIKEKYAPYMTFVKTYDYDMNKVKKVVKKLSKRGLALVVYDTMKADNLTDGQAWQGLIEDSKELFQIVSKENIAGVVTFQLALSQLSKRFLDLSCLANAKQVSEVFSEIWLFRDLFSDEFNGESHDIKPHNFVKDEATGKYTNVKREVTLDRDKKYKLFFLAKTRNDEAGATLLYEHMGHYNKWHELGRCTVENMGV